MLRPSVRSTCCRESPALRALHYVLRARERPSVQAQLGEPSGACSHTPRARAGTFQLQPGIRRGVVGRSASTKGSMLACARASAVPAPSVRDQRREGSPGWAGRGEVRVRPRESITRAWVRAAASLKGPGLHTRPGALGSVTRTLVSRLACTLTAPCRRGVAMPVSSASVRETSSSMVAMRGPQCMSKRNEDARSLCAQRSLRLRRISQGREAATVILTLSVRP